MTKLKRYNIYIFINSFTRVLSSFFIPLILYDKGLYERKIILFYLILYIFSILWVLVYKKLMVILKTTTLMFISTVSFSFTYYYLKLVTHNIYSLIILASLFSNYLIFNNLGRHIIAISITESKRTTENTSMYQIFNILGTILSSFLSVKVIKHLDNDLTLIIIFVLMILSVIPLLNIKIDNRESNKSITKTFPKRNYAFILIDQLRFLATTMFPLYIYIHILNKYSYQSILSAVSGFGSIIYIYFISKKMDKNKKNYLKLSIILLAIIYMLKINVLNSNLFLIIVFFEGIMKSSLDVITLRNIYIYAKNYNVKKYICFIEILNNAARAFFLTIFYVFNIDIKVLIIVSITGMFINSLILFDDGKYGYSKIRKTVV